MESLNEVSLGFAEFVSQLLRETFDAAVSSQNYQNEQYIQIENSLKLSPERFEELYISDDMVFDKTLDIFDQEIHGGMSVNNSLLEKIRDVFSSETALIYNKKITKAGAIIVKKFVIDILVSEKRDTLNLLINDSSSMRLIIDSGEIRAKLELSNIDQEFPTEQIKRKQIENTKETIVSNIVNVDGVKIREVINLSNNSKTLFIDKDSIDTKRSSVLPVRIAAKPVNPHSTSNLFSEVIIKFKTI